MRKRRRKTTGGSLCSELVGRCREKVPNDGDGAQAKRKQHKLQAWQRRICPTLKRDERREKAKEQELGKEENKTKMSSRVRKKRRRDDTVVWDGGEEGSWDEPSGGFWWWGVW